MAYDGPRFRRDLISTVFYEGGVRCVDVHDPKRGATFRLFDYEYSVALAFDGRDVAKVISWVQVTTGLELNADQLTAFAKRLDQLGFLEKPKAEGEATPPPVLFPETPLPLPTPRAPAHPVAKNEGTSLPEAGSLATATRPTSAERRADTGTASPELTSPLEESATVETAQEQAEPAAAEDPAKAAESSEAPSLARTEGAAPDSPGQPTEQPASEKASPALATSQETAAAPSPVDNLLDEAPTQTNPSPSSSEPELPVAVRPSPRERPPQRSARLTTEANPRTGGPVVRRQVTPPPIPRSHLTPTPVPASAPAAQERRSPWVISAFFGIAAALVVGAVVAPFAFGTRPPAPVSVRVLIAKPTDVLRWLDTSSPAEPPPLQTLSFPVGGKVLRIASPGIELRPGDVVAATDAARTALADWSRAQEQLAFSKQLVEGLRDSADQKKIELAQVTVTQKMAMEERALAALSKLAITAKEASTVEQTLANLGQTVEAGGAAVRLRLPGWRARFELPRQQVAQLHKQGLCQAEILGRNVACSFAIDEGDDTHLAIRLPADAVPAAGVPVRLARSRALDATVLPATALSDSNGKPRILVVKAGGRAEMRSVVLADRTTVDAVVTQGLDPGDAVVIESSRPIGAGTPLQVTSTWKP
jgi:hypothetical protein